MRAGYIGNPYWNAPIATGLDAAAKYPTYGFFPGPIGSSAQAFGAPFLGDADVELQARSFRDNSFNAVPRRRALRRSGNDSGYRPRSRVHPLAVQPPTDTVSGYVKPGPALRCGNL